MHLVAMDCIYQAYGPSLCVTKIIKKIRDDDWNILLYFCEIHVWNALIDAIAKHVG